MLLSLRHALPREIRIQRAINHLTRIYLVRRAAGRTTAYLVQRCGLLNQAYLQALNTSRSENAFAGL